jgi:hypothetical protein
MTPPNAMFTVYDVQSGPGGIISVVGYIAIGLGQSLRARELSIRSHGRARRVTQTTFYAIRKLQIIFDILWCLYKFCQVVLINYICILIVDKGFHCTMMLEEI